MIYTKASLMICILVTMQQSQANQFQYPAQIPGANVGTNYQHSDPCDSIIKGNFVLVSTGVAVILSPCRYLAAIS